MITLNNITSYSPHHERLIPLLRRLLNSDLPHVEVPAREGKLLLVKGNNFIKAFRVIDGTIPDRHLFLVSATVAKELTRGTDEQGKGQLLPYIEPEFTKDYSLEDIGMYFSKISIAAAHVLLGVEL